MLTRAARQIEPGRAAFFYRTGRGSAGSHDQVRMLDSLMELRDFNRAAMAATPEERSTKTHENTLTTFRVRSCDLVDRMLFLTYPGLTST